MIQSSFAKACKEYFGFKPGQSLPEFMTELKELDQKDREYFKREFVKVGYEITS